MSDYRDEVCQTFSSTTQRVKTSIRVVHADNRIAFFGELAGTANRWTLLLPMSFDGQFVNSTGISGKTSYISVS
ncbi:MAG: hypothetical protein EKK41_15765 [Hyphomicrobiales bacterium]|nr:MAG: hypothetical protein EKK41_15765 [Hyphomicrobiales bacterium]